MPLAALDPAEDNALFCAERLGPGLQNIIDQRLKAESLLCALTTTFAELLRERGGSNEPLIRAMAAFTEMPALARKQMRDCHRQIKSLISTLRGEGFSLDAVLWAMLGVIISMYRAFGFSADQIDAANIDMISRINEARRLSTN